MEVSIRPFQQDDIPFIKSTWLAHQSYNEPFKHMNEFEFKTAYSKSLDFVMPHLDIIVLCNKEHSDQIYGYICFFNDILNFIYIKGMYRNMGFSKVLIKAAFEGKKITYYTHLSDNKYFKAMVQKNNIKYNKFKFN